MKLDDLIKNCTDVKVVGSLNVDITDICCVASEAKAGSCFVGLSGSKTHGSVFVQEALNNGAKAVLTDVDLTLPDGVVLLLSKDCRRTMTQLSANLWGHPSKKLSLVGLTGTSGKTTVSYLLESIFKAAGFNAGVIGTIGHRYDDMEFVSKHTTPESCDLQRLLFQMSSTGVEFCAMEVSSHALEMQRVLGCHFDCALFTNLTPEHLDFHKDMKNYYAAKKKLFTSLMKDSEKKKKFAVINADDEYGQRLIKDLSLSCISYGLKNADVCCDDIRFVNGMMRMKLSMNKEAMDVKSSLLGKHNAYNILAASAVGLGFEIDRSKILAGIEALKFVPGRLEVVTNDKGIYAFVDYAHKPAALSNVLELLTELRGSMDPRVSSKGGSASGGKPEDDRERASIILVFGCGGDRDKEKRPVMGEIAGRLADCTIVTNDNPRSEDPKSIIDDIVAGLRRVENAKYEICEDRRGAISKAVNLAKRGDIILIAGKGHERYQLMGDKKLEFDDREELRKSIDGKGNF